MAFQAFECDDCKQIKKIEERVRVTLRYEGAVNGTSEVMEVCKGCVEKDDALTGVTDMKPFRQRKKKAEESPGEQASGDRRNEPSHTAAPSPATG